MPARADISGKRPHEASSQFTDISGSAAETVEMAKPTQGLDVLGSQVVVEFVAGVRGFQAPRIAFAGPFQRSARTLVAGVLLMLSLLQSAGPSYASVPRAIAANESGATASSRSRMRASAGMAPISSASSCA